MSTYGAILWVISGAAGVLILAIRYRRAIKDRDRYREQVRNYEILFGRRPQVTIPSDRLRAAAEAVRDKPWAYTTLEADRRAAAIDAALGYTELWEAARLSIEDFDSAASIAESYRLLATAGMLTDAAKRLRAALGMEE